MKKFCVLSTGLAMHERRLAWVCGDDGGISELIRDRKQINKWPVTLSQVSNVN